MLLIAIKKIRFIRQISSEIGLKISCQLLLELSIIMPKKQVRYDVITSRAFASLTDFVSLATPCLADTGVLYAMKGKNRPLRRWQICKLGT